MWADPHAGLEITAHRLPASTLDQQRLIRY
jgi:hypothetical protein